MIKNLIHALEGILLGKPETVELLVMALLADGHVLVEDVPGTGKTTLAKALAAAIGADFARIQFTPDLLPADVTGGAVFKANTGEFEIRKGPVFTQVLLADEINRASPRTQSALLEAMEERQVSLEGQRYKLPELFMVLATENPVEFHGVFPLPEAQMDRFLVRISVGYPTAETELEILRAHRNGRPIDSLTAVTTPEAILKARSEVQKIHIDEALERYVISLVQATRNDGGVRLAASPRAGMNLVRMAQACAFVDGRDFVNPDDIQRVFFPVMEHRVFAKDTGNPEASKKILQGILKQVAVPK
ncbi:MAG: MoxR family ATPase [Fibrobacter sp.]|uniref:AAA family ATPase n=1 Tax=Fibrobacter sp. TaxID=35828 RepID=UPI0025BCECA0|nr:MoxR family ATPase [Fibrobacter sp.]MBQ3714267.1 MoxR family ATPase [Fibrobacter sp.]MBQ7081859.1 MoxR family ATPase [Fibrobacter sp.]